MTGPWYDNTASRQYVPYTGNPTGQGFGPEHLFFNYGQAPQPAAPAPAPAPAPTQGIAAAAQTPDVGDPYGRNTQFTGNVPSQSPAYGGAPQGIGPAGANGYVGGAGSPAAPSPTAASPTASRTGFGPGANVYGGTGVTTAGAMSPLGFSYGTHIDAEGNMHNALTGNPIQGAVGLAGSIAGPVTSLGASYLAGRVVQPATLADLGDRSYNGRTATFRDAISDPKQFSSREVDAARQYDQQRAVPTPVQGDDVSRGAVAVAAESQEGGGNTSGGDHAGNSSGGPGMTGSRSWGGNGTMGSGSGGIGSAARGGMIDYARGGLVASATPGRADAIHTLVEKGTYVIPSDVVSAMGQGNTAAGAKALEALHGRQGRHPGYREGGMVPVRLSGGEFKVHPAVVMHLGNGSIEAGARRLDGLVATKRAQAMHHLATTPGPK